MAVADIDTAAAATVAAALGAADSARALPMDIGDFAGVGAAVAELRSAWGPVDILVNCAGWDRMEPFRDNTPELWSRLIDINLRD